MFRMENLSMKRIKIYIKDIAKLIKAHYHGKHCNFIELDNRGFLYFEFEHKEIETAEIVDKLC